MSESAWIIPGDWDGETWQCIKLQWPDSPLYTRLLLGLLYTLTRGREYDRGSGTITEAQAIGWQIWDANTPLLLCNGDNGTGITHPPTIEYRGGSLIVISEDEMGQVVTDVTIDEDGNLIVHFGACCEHNRGVVVGAIADIEDPPEPEYPEDDEEAPDPPEFYACGKASELLDRLADIGHAAWDNRSTPWNMRSAIIAANPGYSVSMTQVTALWTATIGLMAIELVTDSDIFDAEFLQAWKCKSLDRLADDAGGFNTSDWLWFVGYAYNYALWSENPDLGTFFDVYVASWWGAVCNILGRERANQIMQEGMVNVGDCSECGAQDPMEGLDWSHTFDFLETGGGFSQSPGEGDGWESGVGWKGEDEWYNGTYIRLRSTLKDGDIEGTINYCRMTYQLELGDESQDNNQGVYLQVDSSPESVLYLFQLTRAGAGAGVSTWQGSVSFDVDDPLFSRLVFQHSESDNGEERIIVTKMEIGGMGDMPFTVPE